MGKIIEKLLKTYQEGGTTVSFEFFPAKTDEGISNLLARIEDMAISLEPTFVTLTWRSSFTDESLWLKIASIVQNEFGVDILLHLTCHLPVEDLRRILRNVRAAGLRNILALRGDPPIGAEKWKPCPGGLSNAVDLVRLIREEHGDYFCIAVAAYPEVHTECWNDPDLPPSEQATALDLQRLKEKVDAGADFIITQFFYDVDLLLNFVRNCRDIGIDVPIVPGYLPIQNYQSFKKFTSWCKTVVPERISQQLEKIKDDDDQVRAFGIHEAVQTCRTLLANTTQKSLHFYTMNLQQTVAQILDTLELVPKPHLRKVSWQRHGRPGAGGPQVSTEVRPIFWANRQTSYLVRTNTWDEYPNGRWGDSRSPAYGELSHYYLEFKRPKVNRREIWGEPKNERDVARVFVDFIEGRIHSLPWCELPPTRETQLINTNLKFLNEHGFLTINSQPRVDGAPSTDPDVGWGGEGGYVYQKAYVEFFCSPENWAALHKALEAYPSLSYHAVNLKGEEYINYPREHANAVTWGVFPGREVVQPTIVDPNSFLIWKEEAFELWMTQWATAYEPDSEEYKTIQRVHDTYFLVNVVDNDYTETADVFAVFKKAITDNMNEQALRERVMMVEMENDHLREAIAQLRTLHGASCTEVRQLREELAEARSTIDSLKAQLQELKLTATLRNSTSMRSLNSHN